MNPNQQTTYSQDAMQRPAAFAESRSLAAALGARAPLPSSALFVGLAEDGLPVLVNVRDFAPTAMLVAADAGAGKTRLLQTIARGIELVHSAERVRFAVLTEHVDEWSAFECSPHSDGILTFHHALTTGYLHSVALCRPSSIATSHPLVLLIDGFEALASDGDLRKATDALLGESPPAGIWPIITLNTSGAWSAPALDAFRLRVFGYIRDGKAASSLSGSADSLAGSLQPPYQFAAREHGSWLSFWLPELEPPC